MTAAPQCVWAAGCVAPRLYDGLCEPHLWEAEHTTAYMGGPHIAPDPDCPLCAAPALPSSRSGGPR